MQRSIDKCKKPPLLASYIQPDLRYILYATIPLQIVLLYIVFISTPFALSAPTCLQILHQNSPPPIHQHSTYFFNANVFVHNISHNSLRIHEKCVFYVTKDIKGKSIEPHFPVTLLVIARQRFLDGFSTFSFVTSKTVQILNNNCFLGE